MNPQKRIDIGPLTYAYRAAYHLTRREFVSVFPCAYLTLCRWESGKTSARLSHARRMIKAMDAAHARSLSLRETDCTCANLNGECQGRCPMFRAQYPRFALVVK